MSFQKLFDKKPEGWGLRGDRYAWDLINWHLSDTPLPAAAADREAAIRAAFKAIVGTDLDAPVSEARVPGLPSGGMSGGMIDLGSWRDRFVPLLMKTSLGIPATSKNDFLPVHPATHRYKFAAWAAARAASSSKSARLKVKFASQLLRSVPGLYHLALGTEWLPPRSAFDEEHHRWCCAIIDAAASDEARPMFISYGVAAKLVNCYLKALFLSQFGVPSEDDFDGKIDAIHPPIDRLLLKDLTAKNVGGHKGEWLALYTKGWSNFDHADYVAAIKLIRDATDGRLWAIEAYWTGYQG